MFVGPSDTKRSIVVSISFPDSRNERQVREQDGHRVQRNNENNQTHWLENLKRDRHRIWERIDPRQEICRTTRDIVLRIRLVYENVSGSNRSLRRSGPSTHNKTSHCRRRTSVQEWTRSGVPIDAEETIGIGLTESKRKLWAKYLGTKI